MVLVWILRVHLFAKWQTLWVIYKRYDLFLTFASINDERSMDSDKICFRGFDR